MPANHGMLVGRVADSSDCLVHGIKEALRRDFGPCEIPFEGLGDLCLRDLPNSKPAHLPQSFREVRLDLVPWLTGLGIRVGSRFAAIKLSGECVCQRCGCCGIKAVPKLSHELDAIVCAEVVEVNCARGHMLSLTKSCSERNRLSSS